MYCILIKIIKKKTFEYKSSKMACCYSLAPYIDSTKAPLDGSKSKGLKLNTSG